MMYGERIRQWDFAVKKIFRFNSQRLTFGVDFYNLMNSNVTLGFNDTFVPDTPGWSFADLVHEPARHPPERRIQLVAAPAAGWAHPSSSTRSGAFASGPVFSNRAHAFAARGSPWLLCFRSTLVISDSENEFNSSVRNPRNRISESVYPSELA